MIGNKNNGNILVVDDNPENLRLLAGLLTERQYNVRLAPNGVRALATIRKEAPDLVLLDVMMPEMDGFEVCRQLKKDEQTASIPIIFISALNETIDKVNAFSLGGVDYVTKPFNAAEILARIKTHLSLHFLQKRLEEKNAQLQEALDEIKTLEGIIPICASCKKIRDDEGYWQRMEKYIQERSDAEFSHGLCDECVQELYGDQDWCKARYNK